MKRASLSMMTMMALVSMASAKELFVDCNSANPTKDGLSEATATATIQDAVTKSSDGDTITVLPGIYSEGAFQAGSGKTRIYINKKNLTIRSRDGKEKTHIVGQYDPNSDLGGCGPNAVRCITIQHFLGTTTVQGFTFRDGASQGTQASRSDMTCNRGGGYLFEGDPSTDGRNQYFVDCVFSNNVATRGAAAYGGTFIRCQITRNAASNFGCATRQCEHYNCLINKNYRIEGTAEGAGTLAYPYQTVNCTIVDNDARAVIQMAEQYGPIVNSIIMHNDFGVTADVYIPNLIHCITSNSNAKESGSRYATMGEMFNAPLEDYRLLSTAQSLQNASLEEYNVRMPEQFRDLDLNGNPRLTDGVLWCGAIQEKVVPQGGTIKICPLRDSGTIFVNGHPVLNALYLNSETWPALFHFSFQSKNNHELTYWSLENPTQGGSKTLWPLMDDSQNILLPPQGTTENLFGYVAHEVFHVDANTGSDLNIGDAAHPFETIQRAVTNVNDQVRRVVLVHPGRYDKGKSYQQQAWCRINISAWGKTRIKAIEGPEKTIIVGASDPDDPEWGFGTNAIRCVLLGTRAQAQLQGFTLTGGRTQRSLNDQDQLIVRGGGVEGDSDHRTYSLVSDCIITNCFASRGGACSHANLERCVITGCKSYNNGLTRESILKACLLTGNDVGGKDVVGMGTHIYQSTVTGNQITENGFGLNSYATLTRDCIFFGAPNGRDIEWHSANLDRTLVGSLNGIPPPGATMGDPCFVNAVQQDYRTYACSPAAHLGNAAIEMRATTDVHGVPYTIYPNGTFTAGAVANHLPGIYASADHPRGAITPSGFIPLTAPTNITFTLQNKTQREATGIAVIVNGITQSVEQTTFTLHVSDLYDEQGIAKGFLLNPIYPTDWYVDAVNGNDGNDGSSWDTPKKTLAGALSNAMASERVFVAPGVYNEGSMLPTREQMGYNNDFPLTVGARGYLLPFVSLISKEGPEKTFIVGQDATIEPDSEGRGEDALHCLLLANNTLVKGFTLCGGRTDKKNSEGVDSNGGAIFAPQDHHHVDVQDCIISNNAAYRGGGVRHGTYTRCKFINNRCVAMGSAGRDFIVRSCFFDENKGGTTIIGRIVENCTFGLNNESPDVVVSCWQGLGGQYIKNTLVAAGRVQAQNVYNCAFLEESSLSDMGNNPVQHSGNIFSLDCALIDSEGRPLRGNPVIDAGVLPEADSIVMEGDIGHNQRIYNNQIDIGCYEYDWRPNYATILKEGGNLRVSRVTPYAVAETDAVKLLDGELLCTWKSIAPNASFDITCEALGAGTLSVYVNDTLERTLLVADGEQIIKFHSPEADTDVRCVYRPTSKDDLGARISAFHQTGGTLMILK